MLGWRRHDGDYIVYSYPDNAEVVTVQLLRLGDQDVAEVTVNSSFIFNGYCEGIPGITGLAVTRGRSLIVTETNDRLHHPRPFVKISTS